MNRVIFTKSHVGAYLRAGKLVNLAGYQGRGARAVATPGQMALFAPGDTPASKNPFKGKHPVLDTPDLFTGKTPRDADPAPLESEKLLRDPRANGESFGRLYHGTPLPFDKFRAPGSKVDRGAGYDHQGPGVYLTSDPHGYGRFFARESGAKLALRLAVDGKKEESRKISDGDGHVLHVKLAPGAKILHMEDAPAAVKSLFDHSVGRNDIGEELRDTVRKLGYDGIAFTEPNYPEGWQTKKGARTVVVYNHDKTVIDGHRPAEDYNIPDGHPYWVDKAPADPDSQHPLAAHARRHEEIRKRYAAKHAAGKDTGFERMLLDTSRKTHDSMKAAFDAYHEHGDGTELSDKEGRRHIVLLPDASNPGKYRYQTFDSQGFSSHSTHDTPEKAVADAASQGYTVSNPGILDKLAGTDEWAHGMAINAIMQAHNSGQMPWAEAMDKIKVLHDAREAAKDGHTAEKLNLLKIRQGHKFLGIDSDTDHMRSDALAATGWSAHADTPGNADLAKRAIKEHLASMSKDAPNRARWQAALGEPAAVAEPRHPSTPSRMLLNLVPEERRAEWGELHRQQHELHHYELGQSKERLERARGPMRRAERNMREAEANAKSFRSNALPGSEERAREWDAAAYTFRNEFEKHRAKVDGESAHHQHLYERVAALGRQKEKIAAVTGDMDLDAAAMRKRSTADQAAYEKDKLAEYRAYYKEVGKPKPMRKAWDWLGTEPMHREAPMQILFLKSHVKGYVKTDGTVVQAHDDKRAKPAGRSVMMPATGTPAPGEYERRKKMAEEGEARAAHYQAVQKKDGEHKMNAHRLAEEDTVKEHGTTLGPRAEEHYRRAYMAHLAKLRGE